MIQSFTSSAVAILKFGNGTGYGLARRPLRGWQPGQKKVAR
jgi:hypothetical protein